MEELIRTLESICIEHLVMRKLLAEDKQISRVQELCHLSHYRNAVQTRFRETLYNSEGTLREEITDAQLLAALDTTNLGS